MNQVPTIRLDNGVQIPQFGFGVFQVPPQETAATVRAAFDAGYRHIDTAQMYGNEEGVGRALAESGLSRDEVFVTTKLNNDGHGFDSALKKLDESLAKLRTDHVDLYLIHWPRPREDRYVETWKGFEKALADGKARSIGVSNFSADRIAEWLRLAKEEGLHAPVAVHPHYNLVERGIEADVLPLAREAGLAMAQRRHSIEQVSGVPRPRFDRRARLRQRRAGVAE